MPFRLTLLLLLASNLVYGQFIPLNIRESKLDTAALDSVVALRFLYPQSLLFQKKIYQEMYSCTQNDDFKQAAILMNYYVIDTDTNYHLPDSCGFTNHFLTSHFYKLKIYESLRDNNGYRSNCEAFLNWALQHPSYLNTTQSFLNVIDYYSPAFPNYNLTNNSILSKMKDTFTVSEALNQLRKANTDSLAMYFRLIDYELSNSELNELKTFEPLILKINQRTLKRNYYKIIASNIDQTNYNELVYWTSLFIKYDDYNLLAKISKGYSKPNGKLQLLTNRLQAVEMERKRYSRLMLFGYIGLYLVQLFALYALIDFYLERRTKRSLIKSVEL